MNAFLTAFLPYVTTFDLVFWLNIISTVILCTALYVLFPKWVAVPIVKATNNDHEARRYLVKLGVAFFMLCVAGLVLTFFYSVEGTTTAFIWLSAVQLVLQKKFNSGLKKRSFAAMDNYAAEHALGRA